MEIEKYLNFPTILFEIVEMFSFFHLYNRGIIT